MSASLPPPTLPHLAIGPPQEPMEAESVDTIPEGAWHYEPKWDGFRCLIFRDGDEVYLQSKSGQPLARYFPDVVERARAVPADRWVMDGELVIEVEGRLDFDELLLRLHPAASRVKTLAAAHPASCLAFDLLANRSKPRLMDRPLPERRAALEHLLEGAPNAFLLSPSTDSIELARDWLAGAGGDVDGVVAKRIDLPYASGARSGMQKIKRMRTADCVVGGFRRGAKSSLVGSLLLGLFDDAGLLHHVGFCSGIRTSERAELTRRLDALIEPPGFTGRAPGGPSRWSERSGAWFPLKHDLVVEVRYDHVSGGRFRHGTRLVRWRPDKAPQHCTMEQIEHAGMRLVAVGKRVGKPALPGGRSG